MRDPALAELGIGSNLEKFKMPPCQPPKGKQVIERLNSVIADQPANKLDISKAESQVAQELLDLWIIGDAFIPRKSLRSIKLNISNIRQDFKFLRQLSRKGTPLYEKKVSFFVKFH